jgi:hypothetical protein
MEHFFMSINKQNKISADDKLVIDIRNNLSTRLTDLMSKLLNSTQENLFDMSDTADNNEDKTRYFELMNQLRALKSSMASTFDNKVRELLIPVKEFETWQAREKAKTVDEEDELSLVGQDEMEDMMLVKCIGERASSKYREQLQHLEARLEHLALKTETVFTKNALMPTNFCQAFNDTLADDFSNANKKLLFGMFETEITNKLESLYDSINNRLIDAGVLPQIKLHTDKQKAPGSLPKPQPGTNDATDEAADETQQGDSAGDYADGSGYAETGGYPGSMGRAGSGTGGYPGSMGQAGGGTGGQPGAGMSGTNMNGYAMTAAPGGGYNHANQSSLQSQSNSVGTDGGPVTDPGTGGYYGGGGPSARAENVNNTFSGNQDGSAGNAEYQHYTAGMPANQVGRVLGNYIGGVPFTPGTVDKSSANHGVFFPETTAQHFGHQEIIHALSGIQNLPQFVQQQEARFDAEAIKQAVLAEIAKTSGGAVTKRINQIAEKTIDFIELIFDAIVDDEEISDTIKTLLLRLQIPIIKASMTDQEFFIYDDHPARVLLDTIADVGVGVTEHSDEMYIQLDKIISGILTEHELNADSFQAALNKLNAIIEKQEAAARAVEEEEQLQLLRKHARATVLKTIRSITTGKTLPDAMHPLILKRWPTLMFNHYLKNGKENNEWVDLTLTLRQIVESVQAIASPEQLARLMADKEGLLEQTEHYLNISSKSKKDVQNTLTTYKETLQSHIDDANFSEEEVSIAEETISNAEPMEEPAIEEDTAEKQDIPANAMPGMWFQVYMGEDKTARRCKLSVVIVEDANLMFVNHKGELVTEKSFDEFNEEVANNTTKMIMGHSAFDHAFKAVINQLN